MSQEQISICHELGWRFCTADFSVQASGDLEVSGSVTLVRSPEQKKRWHALPEELKEDDNGPVLYIIGHGLTFEDALENAIWYAKGELPLPAQLEKGQG